MNLQQLRITIDNLFSREDLRVLCFDLNVDFDNLAGETKRDKIAALLRQFDRQNRLPALQNYLQKERAELEWAALFATDISSESPPFMGLRYYDEDESHLFFGRERLTGEFVTHLRRQNCLVVVGASGSGKSSLVRAGIIPILKNNTPLVDGTFPPRDSTTWPIHVITPSAQPLKQLAVSLTRESDAQTTAVLMDDLARDARSLDFFVSKLLVGQGKSRRLLLVVDQFEELFTLCKDEVEQHAFVDNLMTAVSADSSPLILVIVLRADFYDRCARFPALHTVLEQYQKIVGPMSADEIRQAVEQPADLYDYTFEPGLVDLILQDAGVVNGRVPDASILPLLSHALLETWQRRAGRQMTFQGYTEAGRVQGAIAQTAEARYREFDPQEQITARCILLRLADPGDKDAEPTRRLVERTELFPQDVAQHEQVTAVLERLADDRLITTDLAAGEDTVSVVHEALIRRWPRFLEWLQENAVAVRLEHQLSDDAQEWLQSGREESFLYRGQRLTAVQQTLDKAHFNVSEAEFVTAGEAAEHKAQRLKRLRLLAVTSLVVLVIVLLAVIYFIPKEEPLPWTAVYDASPVITITELTNKEPPLYFMGTFHQGIGISENAVDWELFTQGLPADPDLETGFDILAVNLVAFDPATPDIIYANTIDDKDELADGLYYSQDGGQTWEPVAAPLPGEFAIQLIVKGDLLIAKDIDNGLYLSMDGARSWQALTAVACDPTSIPNEIQAVQIGQVTESFYLGAEDGLYQLQLQENCWQLEHLASLPKIWRIEPVQTGLYLVVENPDDISESQIYHWQTSQSPKHLIDMPDVADALAVNPDTTSPDILFISTPKSFWIYATDTGLRQYKQESGIVHDLLAFTDKNGDITRLLQAQESGLFEFVGEIR